MASSTSPAFIINKDDGASHKDNDKDVVAIELNHINNHDHAPAASDAIAIKVADQPQQHHPAFPDITFKGLMDLLDPHKSPDKLESLGGVEGLLKKLHVNPDIGLVTSSTTSAAAILNVSTEESSANLTEAKGPMGAKSDTALAVLDNGVKYVSLEDRRDAFGANVLPQPRIKNLWNYIVNALQDKILILLSVAALVSLAVGLYQDFKPNNGEPTQKIHWIEGFSILVAVFVVVLASSINDLQKEAQFRKLNAKKDDRELKALRDGKTQLISVYSILVGDILLLEPGDVIAADGVFLSGMGLRCDESAATGETDAIKKALDADPFFLSGSKVLEGVGKYLVTGVGEHSFFGRTMMALRTESEDTPLQVKLDDLAERIAKFGVSTSIIMFVVLLLKYIITVLRTNGFGETLASQESGADVVSQLVAILISSIAIIVVAVPEGLPLAVTLALAFATTRMLKDNNLVRVLSACETMGNATTICSDKTGTLTQNKMTVVKGVIGKNVLFEGPDDIKELRGRLEKLPSADAADPTMPLSPSKKRGKGPDAVNLLNIIAEGIARNSSAFESKDEKTGEISLVGSKTETALLNFVKALGEDYNALRNSSEATLVQVYPFSSERKSMSTILKITRPGCKPFYRVHVKGASEIILRKCERFALLPFSDSLYASKPAPVPAPKSRSNPVSPIVCPTDPKDGKPFKDYMSLIDDFASQSLRTICVAYKDLSEEEFHTIIRGELRDRVIAKRREERLEARRKNRNQGGDDDLLLSDEHNHVPLPPPSPMLTTPMVSSGDESGFAIVETPVHPELPYASGIGGTGGGVSGNNLTIPKTGSNFDAQSFQTRIASSSAGEDADLDDITDADVLLDPLARDEFAHERLICAAIVGIQDPLRPEVKDAVLKCQQAGVFVRMVTGDNVITAKSIAEQCGIYRKGGLVMEGAYFRKMSSEEMAEKLPRLQVLARSSPTDKQLLVGKLKELGETVAVTGDGTNDGPALKLSDVGFSMGIAGTEVAKEASAIVLMDDSFSSVVKAIVWGRTVNDAVKKFLQFQISVNFSAVVVTFVSALADANESAVLTAVQLLWVNLLMDTLAALALATDPPNEKVLNRPPESKKVPLITFPMWKMIIGQGLLQIAINLAVVFAGPSMFQFNDLAAAGGLMGADPKEASDIVLHQRAQLRTIVFNIFVFLQIFNMINCRSLGSDLNVFDRFYRNPYFICIMLFVLIGQVIVVEFGGVAFSTVHLDAKYWIISVLVGTLSLPWGVVIRLFPDDAFFSWARRYQPSAHDDIKRKQRHVVQADFAPMLVEAPIPTAHEPITSTTASIAADLFADTTTTIGAYKPRPITKLTIPAGTSSSADAIEPGLTRASRTVSSPEGSLRMTDSPSFSVENTTPGEKLGQTFRNVKTELHVFNLLRGARRGRTDTMSSKAPSMDHVSETGSFAHPSFLAIKEAGGKE